MQKGQCFTVAAGITTAVILAFGLIWAVVFGLAEREAKHHPKVQATYDVVPKGSYVGEGNRDISVYELISHRAGDDEVYIMVVVPGVGVDLLHP